MKKLFAVTRVDVLTVEIEADSAEEAEVLANDMGELDFELQDRDIDVQEICAK